MFSLIPALHIWNCVQLLSEFSTSPNKCQYIQVSSYIHVVQQSWSQVAQVPLPIRVYSTCRNSWVVSWRMWKVHHCSISSIFHHLSPPLTFWPLVHWTGWGWRSGWSQWPLKCHVELCDQEVHVVSVFGLEGLGDDARGFSVLSAPERHAVHLQDHLAHFKLTAVVSWTSPLTMEKKEREKWKSMTGNYCRNGIPWLWPLVKHFLKKKKKNESEVRGLMWG